MKKVATAKMVFKAELSMVEQAHVMLCDVVPWCRMLTTPISAPASQPIGACRLRAKGRERPRGYEGGGGREKKGTEDGDKEK